MNRINRNIILSLLLIFFVSLLCACQSIQSVAKENSENEVIKLEMVQEDLNEQELMHQSDLVIEGKFKGTTPPFRVKPSSEGDPLVFKDSKFEVKKIFKGNLTEGDIVQVRTVGGQVTLEDGSTLTVESGYTDIKFTGKNHYLLFLSFPGRDSGYTTEESYFIPSNGSLAIYEAQELGYVGVKTADKVIEEDQLLSLEKGGSSTEAYIDDLKEVLDSGQITQEEYDRAVKALEETPFGEKIVP